MRWRTIARVFRWPAAFATSLVGLAALSWAVGGSGLLALFTTSSSAAPPSRVLASAAIFVAAVWAMILGMAILHRLLAVGMGPLAVARSMFGEAMRTRSTLTLVLLVFAALAVLPAVMNPDSPLRYRIQSYLAWSHAAIAFFLFLSTILFSAYSVGDDFGGGRANDIFVKPVRRGGYLFGKWLGAVLLNGLLVAVCGGTIGLVTTRWLAQMQPMDDYDAFAVREQVLTARHAILPDAPPELEAAARQRLDELLSHSPGWIRERGGPDAVLKELQDQAQIAWRSIAPYSRRSFIFRDLGNARNVQQIQLRFKIQSARPPGGETLRIGLIANGRPVPLETAINVIQVYSLPATLIDDSGALEIAFVNVDPWNPDAPGGSISFPPDDGLQILYEAGAFGPNLLRAMLVLWAKLAFLAIIAVVAPTLLSFPVACLLCLAVWVMSAGSGEILGAIVLPGPDNAGFVYGRMLVPAVSKIAAQLTRFGQPDTSSLLTDGRLIPWAQVRQHLLVVGLGWTLACGTAGWLLFSRREIAGVQS